MPEHDQDPNATTVPAAPAAPERPRSPSLLTRIIDHLRHQHWTAMAVEFAIVVSGVFLGLALNEARERSALEAGASHSLGMLARDLDADLARIDVVLEAQQKRIDAIAAVADALDAPRPDNAAIAVLLQSLLDNNKTVIARDTVYDVMEAQGQLSVLPPELQTLISQTYAYDFPGLADVSLKNDDVQNDIMVGCVAQHWNWTRNQLIATTRQDIARFQSCLGGVGKFAEYIHALTGGAHRDNALKLRDALRDHGAGEP